MEDNFKLEIISPERIIFSDETTMVTFPSYEGSIATVVLSEKIIFSGLIISILKLSSIKQLLPLPFSQLFEPPLQLNQPCKMQIQVDRHAHLCI